MPVSEPKPIQFARRRVVAIGWLSRIIGMAGALVLVRLNYKLLGEAQFAVFQIMIATLGWVALTSLGLGPALKNLISESRARGESDLHLRRAVAGLLGLLFLFWVVVLAAMAPWATRWLLRKLAHDPVWAIRAFFAGGLLSLLTALGQVSMEVLYAEFRAHRAYLLLIGSAILSLLAVLVLTRLGLPATELVFWVICAMIGPQAIIGIAALHMTGMLAFRARLPNRQLLRLIADLSSRFWLYALLSNLILMVDALVISQVLPARQIVLYTIMSRVVAVGLGLFTTMISVVWPEWTHFWELRQWDLLRRRVRFLALIGPLVCVPAAVAAVFVLPVVIRLWLADANVVPSVLLVIEFLAYLGIRFWTDVHSVALMSGNRVFIASKYLVLQAVITAPLETLLGLRWGAEGVILGLIIGFLLTSAWMFPARFYRDVRSLARADGEGLAAELEIA